MPHESHLRRGPFGKQRGEFNVAVPERVIYAEDWPRRMRAIFAGETVVDSQGESWSTKLDGYRCTTSRWRTFGRTC